MKLEKADVISVDGKSFVVLVTLRDNNKDYIFVNQLTEDEKDVTDKYFIMEVIGDEAIKVNDGDIVKKLFPQMQALLRQEIKNLLNE